MGFLGAILAQGSLQTSIPPSPQINKKNSGFFIFTDYSFFFFFNVQV